MTSDHEAEIRASVAAHQDLGSGYNDAVAEGLVERIGAEIDKRIDARLGASGVAGPGGSAVHFGTGAANGAAGPAVAGGAVTPGSQGRQAPAGYPAYQGYQGPALPPGYQLGPPPARPGPIASGQVATVVTALGSIGLGLGATAIVSGAGTAAQIILTLFIWAAIAVINVVYARRQ
jgi:hypothetical protein